jgi:hypothetical protein
MPMSGAAILEIGKLKEMMYMLSGFIQIRAGTTDKTTVNTVVKLRGP